MAKPPNPLIDKLLANAPQNLAGGDTYDATKIGVPNFNEPPIYPTAAQAFGDVPVNMPLNPLDTGAQMSAPPRRLETTPQATPQAPSALLDLAEKEGALGPKLTDIFSGRATAISGSGAPSPVPPQDPNASVGTVALPQPSTPTSGSGIGTSVVSDVNFLQEGLKQAQSAPPQGLTTAGGTPLDQFLRGGVIPEAGIARAESGLYSSESRGISGEAGRDIMAQASAEREARAAEQFGQARGPDSTDRAAGEMSMADARDLAALKDPRATESEKARAMQVAERLGRDPLTGAPIKTGQEGLTFDQVMKLKDFDFKRDQEAYKRAQDTLAAEGKAEEAFAQDTEALQIIESDANRIGNLVNEAVGLTTETGTTGLSGAIIKHIPGTDANQLKEVLNVVTSKVAIDRLTQIKKTGATLGQISNTELEMLQKSFDTLQQGLTGERLRKALVNYGTALEGIENKIRSQYNAKHKDKMGDQAATQASGSMQSGETTPSGRKVKIY